METKLTPQIVAAYPNVLIKTKEFISRQVGLGYENDLLVLRATGGVIADAFISPVSDCQLILFPLSEISDEDAIEVAKIVNVSQRNAQQFIGCDKNNYASIGKYLVSELHTNFYDFIVRPFVIIQVYDYLRSRSFDMGFGSIPSLITAGLAVKPTAK